MDWIKAIIEKYIGEDGKLDLTKAMVEVKAEFPKNAVPKEVFNATGEDLKAAKQLVNDLKKENKDVEGLQTKIEQYETDIETLKTERLAEKKTYTLKEALTKAGATDVDYMLFKLGDVEVDKDGNILELDNKIKSLKETNAAHFKQENAEDKGGGFKVLDNKLDGGTPPDAEALAIAEFERGLGIIQKK